MILELDGCAPEQAVPPVRFRSRSICIVCLRGAFLALVPAFEVWVEVFETEGHEDASREGDCYGCGAVGLGVVGESHSFPLMLLSHTVSHLEEVNGVVDAKRQTTKESQDVAHLFETQALKTSCRGATLQHVH